VSLDPAAARPAPPARAGLPAALLLALAVLVAYAGGLSGPFVFDDEDGILQNPSIRSLWPLSTPLAPPGGGKPVAGRPVANLSLALSFALSGPDPRPFRIGNALLHTASALLLLGILRRSFASPRLPAPLRAAAPGLALAASLLWAVHPLNSEVVLYAMQRTEALAGCLVLLALYAAIRVADGRAPRAFGALSVAACALAMGSKAVAAAAPLLVLLHDRAFLAGSLGEALRRRGALHASLAACWAILVALELPGPRGESATFLDPAYLEAQLRIVPRYLGLALWPAALVFDYGPLVPDRVPAPGLAGWLFAAAAGASLALAAVAPRLGFAGAWILLLLAPTSSLVAIVTEVGAERRMYLPLAGLLALLCAGGFAAGRAALARGGAGEAWRRALAAALVLALAAGLAARTRVRARDYQSARALWESSLAAWPENPRAHFNLANELRSQGEIAAAVAAYERSLALQESARARGNLGATLAAAGRVGAARPHLRRAVELDPRDAEARSNLGLALTLVGEHEAALRELEEALRLAPDSVEARLLLARAAFAAGRPERARAELERVLELAPENARALALLGQLRAPAPPPRQRRRRGPRRPASSRPAVGARRAPPRH